MATVAEAKVRHRRPYPGFLMKLVGAETAIQTHKALAAYVFLSPWLIGLVLFYVGPIVASAYLSLNDYDIISTPRWVGLGNYERAFFDDSLFWPSFRRTLTYAVVSVPLGLSGSLILAMLLNQSLKATNIFRTLYFLPHLTPSVAMAILWVWLLHPHNGPVNRVLDLIGIQGPRWFASEDWALPALIMISMWAGMGGNRMLIFLAGLQGVPEELHDAAAIDGAGAWRKFWNITIPMISPTILFNLILGVIGALKVFTMSFVATGGGPNYATWFYALHLYRNSFEYFRMGYGCAMAWFLAVVLLIFTAIQLETSRRWVYYAGEGGA